MWTLILLFLSATAFARKTGGGGGYGRTGYGSHSYPSSHGYSGSGTGGHHVYQNANSGGTGGHSYPQSTGYSGNNNVPKQTATHQYNVNHAQKTEVHHHYHNHRYNPPQQIGYGSQSYPVYHGTPPVYVYEYRDSGSRFGDILTGLALYNLGRMSAHNSHHYDASREYRSAPGEFCKFGIRKDNGDYEETRVDCQLMTSFIRETPPQTHVADHQQTERKTITSTVMKTSSNGTGGNSTTVIVTNTTVVDATQAKGEAIKVTPGMTCYLIHVTAHNSMKNTVECGLLQTYAKNSWHNSAERCVPILTMFIFLIFLFQVM